MYYIYMLRCNDGSRHTGMTNNIKGGVNKNITEIGAKYTKLH